MEKQLVNFGQALEALKEGKRAARKGWNGKGMWLILVNYGEHSAKHVDLGNELGVWAVNSYIGLKSAQETFEAGWKPSSIDMLSEDWIILN